MPVTITNVFNRSALTALLSSPSGPVARDMIRRSIKVESAAKRNISGGSSGPKRVDTGRLRSSITHQLVMVAGKPVGRVGTNVKYARWIHDGTGIYGPRGSYIYPKNGRYLVFKVKGKTVFARRVSGIHPNKFLKDALKAAVD